MYGFSKEQQQNVLRQKCAEYRERLERGWQMTEGVPSGHPSVQFWLKLLGEYQDAVTRLHAIGGRE